MAVTITHSTLADGTFSATGAAAWDATHTVSGLGTMAEQDANNVNITGGSITGVTGVLSSLTVNSTPTSGGAAGQIMFDTGSVLQESSNFVWNNANGGLTVSSIANPTIPSLTINGASNYTGATLSGVQITGTAGQFSCNATTLTVGEFVTISGTLGGTGSITGYTNPTTYRISATNGTTTFTLVNATTGAAIVTTSGTPTGLTYTVTDPFINLSQTWNNSNVAFRGLQYNVTDTASNANSLLMNLQVGGVSQFYVAKNGTTLAAGAIRTDASFMLANRFYLRSNTNPFSLGDADDVLLTRRGAANLRFGAADAAAPVAQTLSVQSVVAGTSNTAGANLTITGSQGTGTGAGGSIIFQVAPAGTTGTAQNALVTALVIDGVDCSLTGPTGLTFNIRSAASQNIRVSPGAGGNFATTGGLQLIAGSIYGRNSSASLYLPSAGQMGFGSSSDNIGTNDVILTRRGAANLRFGAADAAAPVAQTLSVQSVVAGTTNTAGANLTITGSQGTGTGVGGSIIFQVAPAGSTGTAQNALATAWQITGAGHLLSGSDNTYDIGASNSLRPRNIFVRGIIYAGPSGLALSDASSSVLVYIQSNASGVSRLTNSSGNDFGRLCFGDYTSSFPALKRSTTILQVRLADDSAYAPVEASTVRTATAYTVATLPAAGTAGRRAYVTDATAPTWLGALTGGGAVVCPVFDNGTAWVAG